MKTQNKIVWTVGVVFFAVVLMQDAAAQNTDLTKETSALFSGSGSCAICHTSRGDVLKDSRGLDLSMPTNWRSTMMGNAARDPLWQAKVESEVSENPALQAIIEDKCTTCHMPMGRTQAVFDSTAPYGLAEGRADMLAMDGVSCTVCHQIQPDSLGTDAGYSGGFVIDSSRTVFGPYDSVRTEIMMESVGYTPIFGAHMQTSELCAACHTLFTPYVDDTGNVAGTFPEQTPYLEWQNSVYEAAGLECQECHMPRIEEPVKIAIQSSSPPRSPFWRHTFVGGNAFMLNILRDNGADMEVTATSAQYDSTIARTLEQLRTQTVNLTTEIMLPDTTLVLKVYIENLTGHKFPTGFPSRRAWLHVLVTNESDETVFESGGVDADGRITNLAGGLEPHRDIITAEDQTQIYENQMVDVNGDVTYTLLRAAGYVKDNRLPPKGFAAGHARYADMAVHGAANDDANFNMGNAGSDSVTYRIDISDQASNLFVRVELLYQTVKPAFVDDLFTHDVPAVNRFQGYYDSADKTPVLIQLFTDEIILRSTGIDDAGSTGIPDRFSLLPGYPNPFNGSTTIAYTITGQQAETALKIYDIRGRLVRTLATGPKKAGRYTALWDGADDDGNVVSSGVYIYRLTVGTKSMARKLIFLK